MRGARIRSRAGAGRAMLAAATALALVAGLSGCDSGSTTGSRDGGDLAGSGDAGLDGGADQDAAPPLPDGPVVRFDPASEDFFDLPFPSDARLHEDGSYGFAEWPRAKDKPLARNWLQAADELVRGWGLVSGMFVWLDGPVDAATLPADEAASVDRSAGWPSVFLMDVDPASPERGTLLPIACKLTLPEGSYGAANQLACISPFGVVRQTLREYALVVTRGVRDADGGAVRASPAMSALLAGETVSGRLGDVDGAPYAAARAFLEGQGLPAEQLAAVVLFTTGDPTARLRRVAAWYESLDAPVMDPDAGLEVARVYDTYVVLQGYTELPIIQAGPLPFSAPPDGKIAFGADGQPVIQSMQRIRFYLTIPRSPMPAGGFPVMLYFHGSGGNAEELIDRGRMPDPDTPPPPGTGPAEVVAAYGVAGFSADFQFHGMRGNPPDTTGLILYNVAGNPRALIDNFIVAACEITRYTRLLEGLTVDPAVAPDYLDPGDAPDGLIRFDGQRISAFGQSMGSTLGLPAATIDPRLRSIVLSGSGGTLIEIAVSSLHPIPVGDAFRTLLAYRPDEVLDRFDPLLSAFQQVYDLVDTEVAARHAFLEPYPGVPAKSVLQPSGLGDEYFSPSARAGLAAALGVDLVEPVLEPFALELMSWTGHGTALTTPVSGNGPGGVTAVSVQYDRDFTHGHFVAFQRDDAKAQYGCFVYTTGLGDAPVLRAPGDAAAGVCVP